jgi:glycine reductase complex component B subunit gamma
VVKEKNVRDTFKQTVQENPGKGLKVVHYVNQYFGGIGGEDKAQVEPQIKAGPTGPGRAIQGILGERAKVVATAICGDNYFAENMDKATGEIVRLISTYQPDIVIAGPAFEAGRYGIACGAVCKAVQVNLHIPAVTGMYLENPGVDLYHKDAYIISTGNSVRTMNDSLNKIVNLALKLAAGQKIGQPLDEGYIPRGLIQNEMSERTGAERVISMLLDKLQGKPFVSEVMQPTFTPVELAESLNDLSTATIALVTDGGLTPRGNPDRLESSNATRFGKYSIKSVEALKAEDYEVNHGGYDGVFIRQDPNRLAPVDVLREMEKEKKISRLFNYFYTTAGVSTTVENSKRMGKAIGEDLRSKGVSGVILTST